MMRLPGFIAAAVLALVLDQLLALADSGLARRTKPRVIIAGVGLALVIAASLIPAGRAALGPRQHTHGGGANN